MNKNKKHLLFVMDTLPLGGISKSLLALLNELGDRYEIDLILMKQEGLFIPLIPSNVNILPEPIGSEYRNPHPRFIFKNLTSLNPKRFFKWLKYSIKCTIAQVFHGKHRMIQVMDVEYAKSANSLNCYYDAAIAYQGGRCIYYIIEKVQAKTKIGYVHSDYKESEFDYCLKKIDKVYFKFLDHIITISEKCAKSLQEVFPEMENKFKIIENICSVKFVKAQAKESVQLLDNSGFKIITMGRLDLYAKGIDLAIESCSKLRARGHNFVWYWLGDGDSRNEVKKLIEQHAVEKEFVLLGAKINPYPYVAQADIYVQPSRFEGKSVALDEVKALSKPCVVTNFTTVRDQFKDNETALIAEINVDSIVDKIEQLITSANLRKQLSKNLDTEEVDNTNQVYLFESLIK